MCVICRADKIVYSNEKLCHLEDGCRHHRLRQYFIVVPDTNYCQFIFDLRVTDAMEHVPYYEMK